MSIFDVFKKKDKQWFEQDHPQEHNPYVSQTRRDIERKIREARESGREKPPKSEKAFDRCIECHGWGNLVETRRVGLKFWLTCDFCGWVEPMEEIHPAILPYWPELMRRSFMSVHRSENPKCMKQCTCGIFGPNDYEELKKPAEAAYALGFLKKDDPKEI